MDESFGKVIDELQILQNTRQALMSRYSQIPQLSCGGHYNLNQPLAVSRPATRSVGFADEWKL
jgi:hypothetical protein